MKKGDKVKVKWVEVDFGIVVRRVPADEVKKRIF